ncbi:MAG: NUDIX hydrolase [Pseudomonadota bacterium]
MIAAGPHDGAKVALFLGDQIISILRDDLVHIPYPNLWDLPGGGREPGETPFETVARELHEELGLVLPPAAVHWQSAFPARPDPRKWVAFFVARLPARTAEDVILGDEGQRWSLYDLDTFIGLPERVPSYGARLQKWLDETGGFAT